MMGARYPARCGAPWGVGQGVGGGWRTGAAAVAAAQVLPLLLLRPPAVSLPPGLSPSPSPTTSPTSLPSPPPPTSLSPWRRRRRRTCGRVRERPRRARVRRVRRARGGVPLLARVRPPRRALAITEGHAIPAPHRFPPFSWRAPARVRDGQGMAAAGGGVPVFFFGGGGGRGGPCPSRTRSTGCSPTSLPEPGGARAGRWGVGWRHRLAQVRPARERLSAGFVPGSWVGSPSFRHDTALPRSCRPAD
jgi:hypothetical protein